MARPLQDFINLLSNKAIRISNAWELSISSGYADVDRKLSDITLYADGFTIPDRSQELVEVKYKGYPLLVPSLMTMKNDHSMTVRCDVNGDIRRVFLKWMNYVTDASVATGSFFGGEKRIPKNAFIRMRLLAGDMVSVVETYKLYGCIPKKVGELKMSNTEAAVVTFDVEFGSQYWEVESTTGDFPAQK